MEKLYDNYIKKLLQYLHNIETIIIYDMESLSKHSCKIKPTSRMSPPSVVWRSLCIKRKKN